MNNGNGLMVEITKFFKTAGRLWGRCPCCGDLFRLSEAAISFNSEPPADWLRRLQRQQEQLTADRSDIENWKGQLDVREGELEGRERDVNWKEANLEKTARALAKGMMKDDKTVKGLVADARRQAVLRSRSTLLGCLFERLAPFFQRFAHDPRDVRALMNPIDYVVFDGLTVNRRVDRVIFVEVKCGTSRESTTQRSIVQAIRQGRVSTETWQIGKRGIPLEQQLLGKPEVHAALPSTS
jgi:predicted Holliday junction resolvase-like endonuclease